jgi:hypothetical protein
MKPNRLTITLVAITVASLAAAPLGAMADDKALAPREVPAKSIPVPTDVSPRHAEVHRGAAQSDVA